MESGELAVAETKNDEPIVHRLPRNVLDLLATFERNGNPYVFASPRKAMAPMWFPRKQWNALLDAAGIPRSRAVDGGFVFHDRRHTAASWVVNRGGTLHEAGDLLGHKSTASTARYAHLAKERRAQLAADNAAKLDYIASNRLWPDDPRNLAGMVYEMCGGSPSRTTIIF